MLKRFFLALLLVLQLSAVANVAVADDPFPGCFPCDDPPAR
jgi:hypothetical protein